MAIYRFYRIQSDGRKLGGTYFEALDDLEAVVSLRLRFEPRDCVLWCEGREVATVPGCKRSSKPAPEPPPSPRLRNL